MNVRTMFKVNTTSTSTYIKHCFCSGARLFGTCVCVVCVCARTGAGREDELQHGVKRDLCYGHPKAGKSAIRPGKTTVVA